MANAGNKESGIPSKIVVGTDGSETAERAVSRAAAFAKALDAQLIIVTAYNNRAPSGVAAAGMTFDAGWAAAGQSAAEKCAAESAEKAMASGLGKVSTLAVGGEPAEALIQVTENEGAELLVVGSKGMHKTARFLMGPIANKVSRRIACDLLIVETESAE
jgi:nucleotide-binding universal stress UspA family protein